MTVYLHREVANGWVGDAEYTSNVCNNPCGWIVPESFERTDSPVIAWPAKYDTSVLCSEVDRDYPYDRIKSDQVRGTKTAMPAPSVLVDDLLVHMSSSTIPQSGKRVMGEGIRVATSHVLRAPL